MNISWCCGLRPMSAEPMRSEFRKVAYLPMAMEKSLSSTSTTPPTV